MDVRLSGAWEILTSACESHHKPDKWETATKATATVMGGPPSCRCFGPLAACTAHQPSRSQHVRTNKHDQVLHVCCAHVVSFISLAFITDLQLLLEPCHWCMMSMRHRAVKMIITQRVFTWTPLMSRDWKIKNTRKGSRTEGKYWKCLQSQIFGCHHEK